MIDRPDEGRLARALGPAVLGVVGVIIFLQVAARVAHRWIPLGPIFRAAQALDQPIRRRLLDDRTIARRSGARSGQRVLLVGAVDGGLIDAFSRIVGREGRLEALALDADGLARARAFLSASRVENANVMPSASGVLPFEDRSFDAVCLVSALGRVAEPRRVYRELWRVLRPAGRLSTSEVASDPTYRLLSTAVSLGEGVGFEPFERFGNALAYTVNFRKPLSSTAS